MKGLFYRLTVGPTVLYGAEYWASIDREVGSTFGSDANDDMDAWSSKKG